MSSRYFGQAMPAIPHLAHGEVADLRNDVEAAFLLQQSEASGPTGSRPATPFTGQCYFNTSLAAVEVWNGAAWVTTQAAASAALTAHITALALTTTPGGASLVGVYDVANHYTATTVEAALAEVYVLAAAKWTQPASAPITGALSTVADAPAKAVLTSIIARLVAIGVATDGTT